MDHTRAAFMLMALVALTSACAKKDDSAKVAAASSPPAAQAPKAPASAPPQAPKPEPPKPSSEELLRAEVKTWTRTPYADNGTSRTGIGNAGFVRAVLHGALAIDVPASHDDQLRTGKLVTRDALAPGDLVFFEGQGFGPFRSRSVGVFVGHDEVAIAHKDVGVGVVRLSDARWDSSFKTARRVSADKNAAPPTFNAANYGSREALLRDIAKAWSGTLYRQGGTTFDGIGNDEFVREVYGAIYDTELEGTPSSWAKMGHSVSRDGLEPGDIILYEAVGIGKLVNQHHAGMYIGEGEFVHSVKGSAVTISKVNDPRWRDAFRAARRIDPVALTRSQEARVEAPHPANEPARPRAGAAPRTAKNAPAAEPAAANGTPPHAASDRELRLRQATETWRGTPYKLGGTSKSGVDCSAFVQAIYKDVFGVDLPRTAEEQERLGSRIDRQRLETGDLLFFRTQGMGPLFKSRHVGLYLGGGEFAQASGSKGVTVTRLDNYYWSKKYEGARRLQNASPGQPPAIARDSASHLPKPSPLLPNPGTR